TGEVIERPGTDLGRVKQDEVRATEEERLCGDDLEPPVFPPLAVRPDLDPRCLQRFRPDLRRRHLDASDPVLAEQIGDGSVLFAGPGNVGNRELHAAALAGSRWAATNTFSSASTSSRGSR